MIPLAKEDMEVLEGMAAKGKQQRVNTPAWGHDLVSSISIPKTRSSSGLSVRETAADVWCLSVCAV